MSIAPINERLDKILPEQVAVQNPDPTTPPDTMNMTGVQDTQPLEYNAGSPSMESEFEPTQVAGIGSKLIGVIKKAPKKAERDIIPELGKLPGDELPPTGKVGSSTVIPAAEQPLVDKVKKAVDTRTATGNIQGKPPEEAFNLTNMQSDDIRAIVGGVSDALGIKTTKVTFDEIKTKAGELGIDEKFLTRLIDNNGKMMPNAVDTYRAMQSLEASAGELDKLFKLVASGQATDVDKLKLQQQISLHGLIQKGVKGIQSETARALAVMRIPRDANVDVIRQVLEQGGGENSLADLSRAYLSLDNQAAKNALLEKSMLSATKDVWFTTWINGLLSSPVSHAKNIMGNAMFGAYQIPERMVASIYSNVLPESMRVGRQSLNPFNDGFNRLVPGSAKEKVEFDEFLTEIQAFTTGTKEGLALASKAWKNNMPNDFASKLELTRGGGQPDIIGDLKAITGATEDTWLSKGIELYGKAVTLPGRALMTEDEFFKGWYYRTAFNRLALRRGKSVYRESIDAGLSEADAITKAEREVADIFTNPPADIDEMAMNYARQGTFQAELPPALKSIEQSFQHPLVKMVVPFFRTPANISMEVIERTPFAPISSRFRDEVVKGGPARDLALAKMTMGSALLATFASMSAEGNLTGRGPGRAADREALQRGGWQPYSFVIPSNLLDSGSVEKLTSMGRVSVGDDKTYVSFNGLEPISAFLAMAADYAEYARYEDDAGKVEEVFMGALYGMFEYMGNQPWLTGVADVATAFGGYRSDNANQNISNTINSLAKQFGSFAIGGSPAGAYGSFVATLERLGAPEASDTRASGLDLPLGVKGFYEAFNKYRSRVPGLSSTLPDKLNLWGDPIMQGQGNPLEMVLPTKVSPGQFSPTDHVLVHLGSPVGMPPRKIQGVEMNADEYNALLSIYGKELSSKQDILDTATSPGFRQASLDVQQKFIRQVHDKNMETARQMLLERSPLLRLRIEEMKQKQEAFGLFYKD